MEIVNSYRSQLIEFNACREGLGWAGEKSLKEIWNTCENPEWLLWLCRMLKVDHSLLDKVICECARLTPEGERNINSILNIIYAKTYINADSNIALNARKETQEKCIKIIKKVINEELILKIGGF